MATIHPTAIVSPQALLADGVDVGPGAIIESDVTIGEGCRIGPYAIIRRYTSMGRLNVVDAHVVLGGDPQDFKFDTNSRSYLRIGDNNVFRECVTINRATGEGQATIVGNRTFWMVYSHAGHNAVIGDDVIFANGAAMAGHTTVERGAVISAHGVLHQFCWMGERVMIQGNAGSTMHVPPYVIVGRRLNCVLGLNVVGMRRAADLTAEDRKQIKEAFVLTYRSGLSRAKALERMDACTDWRPPARGFREFVRKVYTAVKPYNRGLCTLIRGGSSGDVE